MFRLAPLPPPALKDQDSWSPEPVDFVRPSPTKEARERPTSAEPERHPFVEQGRAAGAASCTGAGAGLGLGISGRSQVVSCVLSF